MPVADVLATAEPGVVVETVGGAAAVSHVLEHGGDVGVESCTRTAAPDWYFASGTTVDGSQQDLVLFNPFGDDAIVDVSFVTDTGAQEPASLQALVIPRRSRVTIPVQDSVLRQSASPRTCTLAPGASSPSRRRSSTTSSSTARPATASRSREGTTAPATVWRIPAGSTRERRTRAARAGQLLRRRRERRGEGGRWSAAGTLPAQTVRVPSQGVEVVDVTTPPSRSTPTSPSSRPPARSTAAASRSSPSCWRRGRRRRRPPVSRARSGPPSPRPAGWCRCPTSTPT